MILQIQNLIKQYKQKDIVINAIDNVSFDISKGSFATITGKSGSGKSTLLLTMGGLLKPTSGKIFFNGTLVNTNNDSELTEFRKNNIGYVMQNFALIPYLTAIENIILALSLKKGKNQKKAAIELLEVVGLNDRINHLPRQLSAGQQQRVAIARALASKPQLIFADEPTGNLDPSLSIEILELLKEVNIKQKVTIVMVTHSPVASEYGNIKIQLDKGQIIYKI